MKNLLCKLLFGFAFLGPLVARAQAGRERLHLDLQYNVAFPMGSLRQELTTKPSFAGGAVGLQYQFTPQWRAGLQLGYQYFLQKDQRQVYALSATEQVSAVRQRQLQTTPLMAVATWLPNASNGKAIVQPYLRAGAGLAIHAYQDFLGEYAAADGSKTGFAAQLGGGIKLPFGFRRNASVNLGATYQYMPLNQWGLSGANQLQGNVGLSFPLQ